MKNVFLIPMISLAMSKRRRKKKMLETTFISKSSSTYKPAFNFFKSCQTSARPEWGSHIFGFKIPAGPKKSQVGK